VLVSSSAVTQGRELFVLACVAEVLGSSSVGCGLPGNWTFVEDFALLDDRPPHGMHFSQTDRRKSTRSDAEIILATVRQMNDAMILPVKTTPLIRIPSGVA
jgi:hypothetical protein